MSLRLYLLLYGLPFALMVLYSLRRPRADASAAEFGRWALFAGLALGLLLRLPLLWDSGFHYDTGTYKAWALKLSDPAAPLQIYSEGYFADYPPLYMYVLAALGWLARTLSIEGSAHFTALIKLPALLADVGVTWLIYRAIKGGEPPPRPRFASLPAAQAPASGGGVSKETALLAAGLYWLNPAIIFDSALWGQTEAILALLLIVAWLGWRGDRLWLASLALGAAVAFKPQGLIFAWVYALAVLVSQPLKSTLRQALIGLGGFALIIAPFATDQPLDWIFKLYLSTAATYDYMTVNAYNLWALTGWNWTRDAGHFLGLAAQTWAMLLAGGALSALGLIGGRQLRAADEAASRARIMLWLFALAAIAFFMFAPRMHERYLLTVLPLLALLSARRELRGLLLAWTLTSLANMAYVYHYYVELDEIAPGDTAFIRIVSALNLALTALTLLAWRFPGCLGTLAGWTGRGWARLSPILQEMPAREHWSWRHTLIVTGLGLLALGLGLLRLGAQNYPTNGLRLDSLSAEYRYERPVAASQALVYSGQGEGRWSLQRWQDGSWQVVIAEKEMKDFYRLHELDIDAPSASHRYRLEARGDGWRLNEVGLLDADGQRLVPDEVRSRGRALQIDGTENAVTLLPRDPAQNPLSDEPESWRGRQGYYTTPYFDEIYHARTAHEYLHRLPIYETTHPPLGKWLIAQGIAVFGMTPFGMRVAGVTASALIVAALAWGGWLLVGSARAMWLTGLLGVFEFSRYSIGRYATIDSFLILFLLLSALFLWQRFGRRDDWLGGWRLSPGLAAAGFFLGCAIATKWNAIYFGIGVFLFFVISLTAAVARGGDQGRGALLHSFIGAGAAFGLIPLTVYYTSYAPFLNALPQEPALFSAEGARQVWKSQLDMFDYHAKLTSTHPFSSAFYTWPLLLKPLWLYVAESAAPLRSSITLLGNPLIWWSGLALLIARLAGKLPAPRRETIWLVAGIAALYLPWVAVSRISFIYHYYPIVPLLILLTGATLARLPVTTRGWRLAPWGYTALAGALFALFFPAISGWPVPAGWSASLRWLPGWWML